MKNEYDRGYRDGCNRREHKGPQAGSYARGYTYGASLP